MLAHELPSRIFRSFFCFQVRRTAIERKVRRRTPWLAPSPTSEHWPCGIVAADVRSLYKRPYFSFYVYVYCVFGFHVYQEPLMRSVTISLIQRVFGEHVHSLFLRFLSYVSFLILRIKNYINSTTSYFRFKFFSQLTYLFR